MKIPVMPKPVHNTCVSPACARMPPLTGDSRLPSMTICANVGGYNVFWVELKFSSYFYCFIVNGYFPTHAEYPCSLFPSGSSCPQVHRCVCVCQGRAEHVQGCATRCACTGVCLCMSGQSRAHVWLHVGYVYPACHRCLISVSGAGYRIALNL